MIMTDSCGPSRSPERGLDHRDAGLSAGRAPTPVMRSPPPSRQGDDACMSPGSYGVSSTHEERA
jgi:hypothetical protein